jgi:thioesterase domain-containing protein
MHNNNIELKDFLYHEIPLAEFMQIEIDEASEERVKIHAPLEPNRNHMDTAFGGSIGTVLILSCYVWLYHCLKGQGFNGHVLIKEGKTDYLLPVNENIRATCSAPPKEAIDKFIETFKRRGTAKISMEALIETTEGKAAAFSGVFFAQKAKHE